MTKIELLRYNQISEINSNSIRSIDSINDGKRIIIGTFDSEIFELTSSDLKISQNSKFEISAVNKGPFTLNSTRKYEMWGLAVMKNPENEGKFLTCSDDGILRIWSIKERKLLSYLELFKNSKEQNVLDFDDTKLRCLSISPKEDTVAIGCKSGAIRVTLSHFSDHQFEGNEGRKNDRRKL